MRLTKFGIGPGSNRDGVFI